MSEAFIIDLINMNYFMTFLFIVGLFNIQKKVFTLLRTLYYMVRSSPDLKIYGERSWAVVTGASDGIGQGFCEQLANDGFNICLVSRTQHKLDSVEQKLHKINPSLQTRTVSCDFTKMVTTESYDQLFNKLKGLDVSILVNNVGLNNVSDFDKLEQTKMRDELIVNSIPIITMSYRFIPYMLQRPTKSAIINLSSFMAEKVSPRASTYNSTKSFNDMFSRSIGLQHPSTIYEYLGKIDVLSVRPMYVTTNMARGYKGFFAISPSQCARASLNKLGIESYTYGHWFHGLQAHLVTLIPFWFIRLLFARKIRERPEVLKSQNA